MIEIAIIITICILIALVLKLLNYRYNIKKYDIPKASTYKIIQEEPTYSEYKIVSSKASPPNKPQRTKGDFFDYIKCGLTVEKNAIENRLLDIYGENIYE